MIVINKYKPLYIDKKQKKIRMGNFVETGKEIDYEEDSILSIFNNVQKPISESKLVDIVNKETNVSKIDIKKAIAYLIQEGFIINYKSYKCTLADEKYNRQELYFKMFDSRIEKSVEKICDKNILILGLGSIGANAAIILSKAGFNRFILVDFDKVEKTNMIRQFAYSDRDIGKLKTDCLYKKIKNRNNVVIKKNIMVLSEEDIKSEVATADFVLCTLDYPIRKIRRIINSVCVKEKKPVLFCGFSEHVGMIGPFVIPGETACLSCIDKQETEEALNNVSIIPSYGPLCATLSGFACNEIINYYIKYNPKNLCGKTLMINFATYKTKIIKWKKEENCKECGNNDSK